MFGSEILDVAIGLALIYLLLSLVASAVREGIEGVIKARAIYLERGIRELLDDPTGGKLARRFYEHPLISPLYPGQYVPSVTRRLGRNMPTYIPARNFAAALLDLTLRSDDIGPYGALRTTPVLSIDELRVSAQRIESPLVQRALLSALDRAQGRLTGAQTNLEAWFDSAMDSVSGWYKRRTQLYLYGIAAVTTVALNVNTVTIAKHLWRNDAARQALVRRAEAVANDTAYLRLARDTTDSAAAIRERYEDLASLDLPIGWDRVAPLPDQNARGAEQVTYWLGQLLGLLLTIFAVTLGAPFWFDTLNKFIVIRSTVKPREKSPEEASEDRQRPKAPTDSRGELSQPASADVSPSGSATPSSRVPPPVAPTIEPPHDDQEWARGDDKEKGVL